MPSMQDAEMAELEAAEAGVVHHQVETAVVAGPKAAGKRRGKQYGPCRVCGLLKDDMPTNSIDCWDHKRSADALVAQIKAADRAAGTTSGMDDFNRTKNEAKEPPSPLSHLILDFEKRSPPPSARGVKRKAVDTMQLLQKHSVRTQMRKELVNHGAQLLFSRL